jgi:hypothetical protein
LSRNLKRKPIPGRWYVEDDKGVKLYCMGLDGNRVQLSYRGPKDPGGSVCAVYPPLDDFNIFFTLLPKVHVEDQSKNGVRVIVTRTKDGSHVDASCQCFGQPMRAHSNVGCPNLKDWPM